MNSAFMHRAAIGAAIAVVELCAPAARRRSYKLIDKNAGPLLRRRSASSSTAR